MEFPMFDERMVYEVVPQDRYTWSYFTFTPLIGVITPVTYLCSAIYRGYNSIYNWWGPSYWISEISK